MATTPANRFDSFNHFKTTYKTINGHGIDVNLLIPKDAKPGKHPLIVKFHGGGLVLGEAMYPDWFAAWFVPFITRNNAITILPNYRLIPEHNGKDIKEDLRDFWLWFGSELAGFVTEKAPGIEPDFQKLLVSGESAGGLMALQSAIFGPEGKIKALLTQYPMTNALRGKGPDSDFFGMKAPGPEYIDQYMASVKPGTVLSSSVPYERVPLANALTAYGRWLEFYGKEPELLPITSVERVKAFPPALIIHGEQDTAVSVEDSRAFVRKVESVLGKEAARDVKLITSEGEHGFDVESLEDGVPGLKDGLKWVESKWLA